MQILIILFFTLLLLSAFFSASETAFLSIDRLRIKFLERRGDKKAKKIKLILNSPEGFLSTVLVGNNLVNIALASVSVLMFTSLQIKKEEAILYSTVFTTIMVLIFGEIFPKTFSAYHPESFVRICFFPFRIFMFIFYPVSKLLSYLSRSFLKIFAVRKSSTIQKMDVEEELEFILRENPWKEMIPKERKEMLERVFDIKHILVKEIMIPRVKVVAIRIDASIQEIINLIKDSEFSRYPAYEDTLDNIKGIVHSKDILNWINDPSFSLKKILREAYFVPDSAFAEDVLKGMRKRKTHMAIVTDEWGGMVGIMTLEDILEELVGEIQDEYDEEEEGIKKISEREYLVSGSVSVKTLKRTLKIDIPEKSSYVTLAGFIMSMLEKIPSKSDVLNFGKIKFIIEEMAKHQIGKVRIIVEREENEDSSNK